MIEEDIITKIFVECDDFVKKFNKKYKKYLLPSKNEKKRNKPSSLTTSEVMTILIYYHKSGYKYFKYYYLNSYLELKKYFPKLISYKRIVNMAKDVLVYLMAFMLFARKGKNTDIAFIDSTSIKVCDNKRIHGHKVFKGLAKRGKTSKGWFYGFKLHLVVNELGEILGFTFTPANVSDVNKDVVLQITKNFQGKLFGDRGYISKDLFETLYEKGIQLITKIRKNMKNTLMPLMDKLLLRKRAIIETINDELKNIYDLEHSRHRSPVNAMVNWICALIAYSFRDKKPSIRNEVEIKNLLLVK